MLPVLIIAGATLAAVYFMLQALTKLLFKKRLGVFASLCISAAFFIGTFLLQMVITNVLFGIGPAVLEGTISEPSAIKYSLMSAGAAAYLAWSTFRTWAPTNESP